MQGQLAALAEGLLAAVDPADEGLLVGVSVLVFLQVLRQREGLAAVLAREGLLVTVDVVVPLQGELGREAFPASRELALVHTLREGAAFRGGADAIGSSRIFLHIALIIY